MSDATLRIKNLSISLEALSRINNEGSPRLYDAIEEMLHNEIRQLAKEQKERSQSARSAESSVDDDIPF